MSMQVARDWGFATHPGTWTPVCVYALKNTGDRKWVSPMHRDITILCIEGLALWEEFQCSQGVILEHCAGRITSERIVVSWNQRPRDQVASYMLLSSYRWRKPRSSVKAWLSRKSSIIFSDSATDDKNLKSFRSPLTLRKENSAVASRKAVLRAKVTSLYSLCLFSDFTKSTTAEGKDEAEEEDEVDDDAEAEEDDEEMVGEEEESRSSAQGGLLRYIGDSMPMFSSPNAKASVSDSDKHFLFSALAFTVSYFISNVRSERFKKSSSIPISALSPLSN
eukprot:Gb_01113 [translate_table: standard]